VNVETGRQATTTAQRWAWYSIAVNVLLVISNVIVAGLSGSLAVSAEAVHNGVDLLSAIAVLAGIKLATRKSRDFPYGLYKLENIIAVAVAFLIFLSAYEILRRAIVGSLAEPAVSPWMFAVLGMALAVPAAFSHAELRVGRRLRSPALIADAKEYRVHALTTGVALAALVSAYFRFPLDRAAAAIIAVPVAKTGWDLLVEGVRVLLDVSIEPQTLETIRRIALEDPRVADVTAVTGRNAGRFRFVEITISLRSHDLEHADRAAHDIEHRIRHEVDNVERVLIHVDPKAPDRLRCAIPLADANGGLAEHFGSAPLFAMATLHTIDGEILSTDVLENPFQDAERSKGIQVAEWLVDQKADVVVIRGEPGGKGPSYVFGNAAVEVHHTTSGSLPEVVGEIAEAHRPSSPS
jgi:cation diffusion facilitator family transporter